MIQRNERGQIVKANGEIDKRSLRFMGRRKKRKPSPGSSLRDAEGYLLNRDGTRNPRSVSMINALRSGREESEVPE